MQGPSHAAMEMYVEKVMMMAGNYTLKTRIWSSSI